MLSSVNVRLTSSLSLRSMALSKATSVCLPWYSNVCAAQAWLISVMILLNAYKIQAVTDGFWAVGMDSDIHSPLCKTFEVFDTIITDHCNNDSRKVLDLTPSFRQFVQTCLATVSILDSDVQYWKKETDYISVSWLANTLGNLLSGRIFDGSYDSETSPLAEKVIKMHTVTTGSPLLDRVAELVVHIAHHICARAVADDDTGTLEQIMGMFNAFKMTFEGKWDTKHVYHNEERYVRLLSALLNVVGLSSREATDSIPWTLSWSVPELFQVVEFTCHENLTLVVGIVR